jgi:hypothetical protein
MKNLSYLAILSLLSCQKVALLALPTTEGCAPPFDAPVPDTPLKDFLRYNFVQQKSVHNAYDKDLTLTEQLGLGLRSLELDLHVTRGRAEPLPRDWYVFHIDAPFLRSTNCEALSFCLQELATFHEAQPNHEVITVWIDLKSDFTAEHSPQALDAILEQSFPPGAIFTPAQLLSSCPEATHLRDAVQGTCRWPTLNELTGKFIFAVTGSGLAPGELLTKYLDGDATARIAFAATDLERQEEIGAFTDAVFYNLNLDQAHLMPEVLARGLAGRIWKTNQSGVWRRASVSCANHIATDRLNLEKYPWASTQNSSGWPFFCFESLGVDCSQLREE